ncbi:ead/Ea22-like family protein [Raoultella planticola]|uniref:ead/Ea22-like family protein n=1 Tax=Raoultella planticola TaxID=575 RepID=UPI002FF46570
MSKSFPEWWKHGQKVRTANDGVLTLNIAEDSEYWLTNNAGKEVSVFSMDILGPASVPEACSMTTDITELAQSLKRRATSANEFGESLYVKGADVIALVEALERKEEQRANWSQMAQKLGEDLDAAEKRLAELEAQNEYIRKRYQQLDLLIGKNILVMQAAIIEWQATGDAKNGLAWIYNTLFGPGELPDEAEKDAQAYFDRKYAPLDEELMALHKWFWEQSEAERAAAGIKVEDE